jgi:hypothetical protein
MRCSNPVDHLGTASSTSCVGRPDHGDSLDCPNCVCFSRAVWDRIGGDGGTILNRESRQNPQVRLRRHCSSDRVRWILIAVNAALASRFLGGRWSRGIVRRTRGISRTRILGAFLRQRRAAIKSGNRNRIADSVRARQGSTYVKQQSDQRR